MGHYYSEKAHTVSDEATYLQCVCVTRAVFTTATPVHAVDLSTFYEDSFSISICNFALGHASFRVQPVVHELYMATLARSWCDVSSNCKLSCNHEEQSYRRGICSFTFRVLLAI